MTYRTSADSVRRTTTVLLLLAAVAALAAAIATRSRVGHPVTDRMRAAASAVAGSSATALPVGVQGRPTVIIFIKEGCPCSEAADPCFRRLFTVYGDQVAFLGIIDGDASVAKRWTEEHDTPYPVLADPDLKLIQGYQAERSAYVALINRAGTVDRLWPGYSAGMLRELGTRLAHAGGTTEETLDVGDAPEELTSGCSFSIQRVK